MILKYFKCMYTQETNRMMSKKNLKAILKIGKDVYYIFKFFLHKLQKNCIPKRIKNKKVIKHQNNSLCTLNFFLCLSFF